MAAGHLEASEPNGLEESAHAPRQAIEHPDGGAEGIRVLALRLVRERDLQTGWPEKQHARQLVPLVEVCLERRECPLDARAPLRLQRLCASLTRERLRQGGGIEEVGRRFPERRGERSRRTPLAGPHAVELEQIAQPLPERLQLLHEAPAKRLAHRLQNGAVESERRVGAQVEGQAVGHEPTELVELLAQR
jgi:hypothetical protein